MHILFAGGGTAGHINPAIAVAAHLKNKYPDCKISYIGTKKGMESRLVPMAGYDFYTIEISGFQRKISLENIKKNVITVFRLFSSTSQSKKLYLMLIKRNQVSRQRLGFNFNLYRV